MQRGQTSNNNSTVRCYKCGGIGHKIADCPSPNNTMQAAPRSEYRYRPRYQASKPGAPHYNKRFHRCLVCGKLGHNEHECRFRYQGPQLRKAQTETSTDESTCSLCGIHCLAFTICDNCLQVGHSFAHCPNNPRCRRCGEEGHTARKCSNAVLCRNCFQLGHWTRDCTNEPVCANCKETGHKVHECPQLVEQSE